MLKDSGARLLAPDGFDWLGNVGALIITFAILFIFIFFLGGGCAA